MSKPKTKPAPAPIVEVPAAVTQLEEGIIDRVKMLLQHYHYTRRECEKILEKAYQQVGPRPSYPKTFRVFRVSTNTNSFCLYGHWLLARDGECWEMAKHEQLKKGTDLNVLANPDTRIPNWGALGFEIPERKTPDAPAEVVREVFPT